MFRFGNIALCAVFCCLISLGQGNKVSTDTVTITLPSIVTVDNSFTPSSTNSESVTSKASSVPIAVTNNDGTISLITSSTKTPTADITSEHSIVPEEKNTTTSSTTSTTSSTTSTTSTTTTPPTPKPTPSPKPTTTPKPGPVPPPKPLPPPEQGNWSWTDSKNVTCILVQFAAQLNVTYQKSVNNATSLAYVILNVPANATSSDGNCNGTEQWLQISWPATANSSELSNLTFTFQKNDTTKNYVLKTLNLTLASQLYPNASSPVEFHHGAEWQTPLATSYRCAAPTQLNMTTDSFSQAAAGLTLSNLQEEAFRTAHGKGFSAARECGAGDIPDVVPIVVGCSLGGLVVVVLVAYLVARHRSSSRGYLSM